MAAPAATPGCIKGEEGRERGGGGVEMEVQRRKVQRTSRSEERTAL